MKEDVLDIKSKIKWGKILLFNFMVVATLGVLLRYKIAFSLPWLDQKNLHHAHSHFAFSGWVSLGLMLLMFYFLKEKTKINLKRYNMVFLLQILVSYGMLVCFALSGYSAISIVFSSLSIVVFAIFGAFFYKDSKQIPDHPSKKWYYASLVLGLISTLGTFSIARMSYMHHFEQHMYLASVYFFLHFQYNGWFFFSIIGSLIYFLKEKNLFDFKDNKIFLAFAISIIPTYGLSILWLNLNVFIYTIVVFGAAIQLIALFYLIKRVLKVLKSQFTPADSALKLLFIYAGGAVLIKYLLQMGSVIPQLSELAFGFRPVVIAYLHLVLLAFTSVMLIGLLIANGVIIIGRNSNWNLKLILVGIFLNELILAIQSIASFDYAVLPHVDLLLLGIAIIIWSGLLSLFYYQYSNTSKE